MDKYSKKNIQMIKKETAFFNAVSQHISLHSVFLDEFLIATS